MFCILPEFYIGLTLMWQLYTSLLCQWQALNIEHFQKQFYFANISRFQNLWQNNSTMKQHFHTTHPWPSIKNKSECDGENIAENV